MNVCDCEIVCCWKVETCWTLIIITNLNGGRACRVYIGLQVDNYYQSNSNQNSNEL